MRFIVDQGCGYLFTCFGFSLLVVVLWCVGNPDLWDRGLVCFWGTFLCGLFTPTNPLPGHRVVPESHRLSAVGLSYALETINYKLNDVDPTLS